MNCANCRPISYGRLSRAVNLHYRRGRRARAPGGGSHLPTGCGGRPYALRGAPGVRHARQRRPSVTDTTARAALLVDTQWVADHLEDPNLRIVDIRGAIKPPSEPKPWYRAKHEAYRESHIPGAHFVDWTDDIVEPAAPIHMTLAGPERFRTLMEQLGIGDDSEVVVYDDSGSLAPRLWWALNYYGHPRVRVLDGGRSQG